VSVAHTVFIRITSPGTVTQDLIKQTLRTFQKLTRFSIDFSDPDWFDFFIVFGRETTRHNLWPTIALFVLPWLMLFSTLAWLIDHKNEETAGPDIGLPETYTRRSYRIGSNKKGRWRPTNYFLSLRMNSRPIRRPKRDDPYCWWKPLTWVWRRRTPIPVPRGPRWKKARTSKPSGSDRRKRRRTRYRKHRILETEIEEKTTKETEEEHQEEWARVRHRLLHQSWIMIDFQFGVTLDEFVSKLDPVQQFLNIKALSSPSFLSNGKGRYGLKTKARNAFIAAAKLSKEFGNGETIGPTTAAHRYETMEMKELSMNRSVYLSNRDDDDLPIVIDSGCSKSLTPNKNDFVGDIEPASTKELSGLNNTIKVVGEGWVDWPIRDVFGTVRSIRTRAYYVPTATIRLFSPQTYFQEGQEGELRLNSRATELELHDGTTLEFPYNHWSNLPIMLSAHSHECRATAGLTYEDAMSLCDGKSLYDFISVAAEENQNLRPEQKELLLLHQKLGHANQQWVQKLAVQSTTRKTILVPKLAKVSSCERPLCTACQLGKQHRRTPGTESRANIPEKDMHLRREHLQPGDMVSMDQYISALPGRLPHTKGKEPKKDKYNGGTIFVDHATGFTFLRNQISLKTGETLRAKKAFEQMAAQSGVTVKGYRADNQPFSSEKFKENISDNNQTLTFSGVGAHHQNGVAERAVKTITTWARTMLLHAVIMWPDQANLELWPFALEHAIYLWNNIPAKDSLMAPIELFTGSVFPSYDHIRRSHVWGCPVYVLDPKLQDGKKLPKWDPRSRRGQYLGVSPAHSSTIGRIHNLQTGHVSPQYHVVYDELFTTVPNAEAGGLFSIQTFDATTWAKVLESGIERNGDMDLEGSNGDLPELHDEWLTPMEQQQRQAHRRLRLQRRLANLTPAPATEAGPEGGVQEEPAPEAANDNDDNDDDSVPDLLAGPLDSDSDDDDDDDENGNEMPNDDDDLSLPEGEPQTKSPLTRKSGRKVRKPIRFRSGSMKCSRKRAFKGFKNNSSYSYGANPKQKIKAGTLNEQFLMSLKWTQALEFMKSADLKAMLMKIDEHTDLDEGTVEWMHPLILAMKANAEDNPNWQQAMNGPDKAGYWEACEKEINTLIEKEAWDEVDREEWMNVLPSTWAFKCKRFPDGMIRKLKARFCVRGDMQVEGVDYFDTFAPVVNWTTVRLMLILSIILGLATKQVDYTAAFVHAPIDRDPDWDTLTEEEQKKRGVFVASPRGFSSPGKVLSLKRSLYGLKQAPRNFFLHLKEKLEKVGFESKTDVDPCLFISDKVICIVYVDDTLLYSPKEEYIDEILAKLEAEGMELEVEASVAGFLGVHMERNENNDTITLTQTGLTKRIVEALNVDQQPRKFTPATREPLVKNIDGDPPNGTYSYASVIGMLQYLHSHSRPDITFAVSQCARFIHHTRRTHEEALERIGNYLKGTIDKGLILKPNTGVLDIDCYVDADFAGLWPLEDHQDPSCVKSRTGFVICISNCPVIWSSKLQTDIALSTMEAEYNALSMSMREVIPLQRLTRAVASGVGLPEERVTSFKTTVWEDNSGALTLARMEPGRMTPRSKHYAIKYHWFRSHLRPQRVEVKKIATAEQKADIFTKGLRKHTFEQIRFLLSGW
jgi:hypothetical protein